MLCPNCKTETLVTSERQSVQIDHCPRCRGVWLDRGELEKLLQMDSPSASQSERYKDREFGEDEEAPRKRTYNQDDDDDDDRSSERGESYQGRDRDDDDRGETYRNRERGADDRGDTYRNRDRDYDQRTGRDDPQGGRSIWREIFENLGDKLPRT